MQLELFRRMGPDRGRSLGMRLSDEVIRTSRGVFLERHEMSSRVSDKQ